MDQVVNYLNDSFPSMKASEFLTFVSQVKRLFDVSEGLKEERKEKEDFDWLFKANNQMKPNPLPV